MIDSLLSIIIVINAVGGEAYLAHLHTITRHDLSPPTVAFVARRRQARQENSFKTFNKTKQN